MIRLKIDGHTNAQFAYLPLPLEYILPELLKNSFRATIEHHNRGAGGGSSSNAPLPDVSVTIAVNEKDFIIRIRDRGGGKRIVLFLYRLCFLLYSPSHYYE